jgi:hypothetical protein
VLVKDTEGNLVSCPRCGAKDIRYSETTRLLDLPMWFRHMHSLRCRACRTRFYAPTDEAANVMWVK